MKTNGSKMKVTDLTLIALFAAIVSVLSQVSVPMPSGVPITLQTFAVALCGYYLGVKKGTAAIGVYILLGAVGVPVFTNFKGGFACLFSVTGGFIWGFLIFAALCGLRFRKKPLRIVFGLLGGLILHFCGALQYALVMGIDLIQSFLTVSAPYLIKDGVSVVLAFSLSEVIRRAVGRFFPVAER
ncbi:MAG: biotin transporter BioY [Bacteroides sp.]|nr:biotin transporter BioY [Eubacterium sp.]MCM1419410.1 biotin transporter BioY [Roseburia sp.]MCM1463003.1 biotin transporter BioY [Bacteroides sp.]